MQVNIISIILCILFLNTQNITAQKSRFIAGYPISTPTSNADYKEEILKTASAMLGGLKLLDSPNLPKSKADKEAYLAEDYKTALNEMTNYAIGLCDKAGKVYLKDLEKVAKSIKTSKYSAASGFLLKMGAKASQDSEKSFFIWKDYLEDIKNNAPWINPKNIKVNYIYQTMLHYIGSNYDRPFGVQAEQGAIIADGAQALSNCLENPNELDWKGELKMSMKEGDQLRRLASDVAYYAWRRHDKNSGMRAAHIDTKIVRLLQISLYDTVRSIMDRKGGWDADPAHGKNLLALFEATISNGWSVNGDKAKRQ